MSAQKINQWQTLRDQLNQVSNDIELQVERAYFAYRIDEVQGCNNLVPSQKNA
jgi:predicted transport protein